MGALLLGISSLATARMMYDDTNHIVIDGRSVEVAIRPFERYLDNHPLTEKTMTWWDYLTGWSLEKGWSERERQISEYNYNLSDDYQIRWEIKDGKLILTHIFDEVWGEVWDHPYQTHSSAAKRIAPNLKLPTVATWYSGVLVIPSDHVILIKVEQGIVKERRDMPTDDFERMRKEQFAQHIKTSAYQSKVKRNIKAERARFEEAHPDVVGGLSDLEIEMETQELEYYRLVDQWIKI